MGRGLRAKYLLPCFCIGDSLKFDKQHDHLLKKLNFDLLTQPQGQGGLLRGGGGVFRQNICYHIAAVMIPFDFICIMQHDHVLKKLNSNLLSFDPNPRVRAIGGWWSAGKILATMLLHS